MEQYRGPKIEAGFLGGPRFFPYAGLPPRNSGRYRCLVARTSPSRPRVTETFWHGAPIPALSTTSLDLGRSRREDDSDTLAGCHRTLSKFAMVALAAGTSSRQVDGCAPTEVQSIQMGESARGYRRRWHRRTSIGQFGVVVGGTGPPSVEIHRGTPFCVSTPSSSVGIHSPCWMTHFVTLSSACV